MASKRDLTSELLMKQQEARQNPIIPDRPFRCYYLPSCPFVTKTICIGRAKNPSTYDDLCGGCPKYEKAKKDLLPPRRPKALPIRKPKKGVK